MTFAAQMRIGSLEITALLAFAALIASRPRAGSAAEIGNLMPVNAMLRVIEFGRERIFEGLCPLTIGRDRSCQLVLADVEVSRKHARLETKDGVVYVRDLGSSNGTFINGRRVTSAIETREGDAIDVGTTRLLVERLEEWT
ncbi:MAG TPA: FHA domain-containing protein [Candidatus Baltobacteraceae bacterium]|nr:FHA domain-containing protein [Candidatus Baltobacteraceae bacterium]